MSKSNLLNLVGENTIPKTNKLVFGFLPRNDAYSIFLLIALYMLQGVPVGLVFGTLPFLLKQKLSFSDMAIFSFAGYPYSLKLLWSPVVDSIYSRRIGRRKSWIVPIQLISGLVFLALSGYMKYTLESNTVDIVSLTVIWCFVIFLCATQDIAVDGWALTLLSQENMEFCSTCQTVGINIGYFASFTIFLALNSSDFCNKYLRSVPMEIGVIDLPGYLKFWGYFYILLTILLFLFKKEKLNHQIERINLPNAYSQIISILKLPHILKLSAILLIAKIPFTANEAVTGLKLLDKGIQKEDLALTVLIDFPFQLLFGYFAAQWSSGNKPLKPWFLAYYGRLLCAALGPILVYTFPESKQISNSYFFAVVIATVFSNFMSTVQFVGLGAFFSKIADPIIGGTYMTLLNTISNMGGTWPRFFVLEAVDFFTVAKCSSNGSSCVNDAEKSECIASKGVCNVERDGYFLVSIVSVIFGIFILFFGIGPRIEGLQKLKPSAWKIHKQS